MKRIIFLVSMLTFLAGIVGIPDINALETTETDILNYAELHILVEEYQAVTDTILVEITSQSLRYHYLMGVSYQHQQKWPQAIEHFQKAIKIDPNNERSMVALSYLNLGKSLKETKEYQTAIEILSTIPAEYNGVLKKDYPRYPPYVDDPERGIHYIADDAQFLIAECYEAMGDTQSACRAYAKISRFYPFSMKLSAAEEKLDHIVGE